MFILKNKSDINSIFESGKSVSDGIFMIKFIESTSSGILFAVSSKKFKRAVDRNRIKRLMKESVRSENIGNKKMAIVYIGEGIPNFSKVNASIKRNLSKC